MQCLNPWTQWNVFQQCMSLTQIQSSTCPWTAGPSLSRKCIHHTTKQWFKTVHEYFRFDRTQASIRQAVLETSRDSILGNDTEKSIVLPPLPPPWISFPAVSTRHVSLNYKACLNLSMDLLRHFKTQWILYETRKLSRTLIRKVLI
ncbi:hypothetical protein TNCT_404241 [Trichonephila clavata]|uniref:Uncharacterized protein n=1 Tax=Trichonephila clavata TaxID=2740835 RepID=A0A8X6LUU9_TRICU|nr:hypothetical protein TNCT_404241 [Trichonephila clavata]